MRTFFLISTIIILFALSGNGQIKPSWVKWSFLIGEWIGEGSGQPGQGNGSFSFYPDLDRNILVRKNHTGFPAAGNIPATKHDDLLIIYPENEETPSKAIYFDNEGHVIHYSISYRDSSVFLTSEKKTGNPVFRLTYTPSGKDFVVTKFEMSRDGEVFMTYIEGKSKRIK